MIKTSLVICFLAVTCLCGCSALLARNSQLSTSRGIPGTPPTRGLRVTEVFADSPAAAAGIHSMDVITQYGEYPILDDASFFAARNHYDNPFSKKVEIVVWRGTYRMSATVSTGKLGVMTLDNDKISEEFLSLMTRINTMREIPEYMLDREFKGQFKEGPSAILAKAETLIDEAERNGSLTPTQIQLARIHMILDDAPVEDQKRLTQLLKQLLDTQPVNFIHMLGQDKFFQGKRYRAAIACFNRYLETEPDDISIRLNMANAYNRVGMYEQAEAAAKYVLDHNLGVSEHGSFVANQMIATAALGQKDYRKSVQFAWKAFAATHELHSLMTVQLASAQTGDIAGFEQAVQKLQEVEPAKYIELKLQIDAADAYAMVKNNEKDTARKLVRAWKDLDRAEGKVISFWRDFPDGMDVARNWAELMHN